MKLQVNARKFPQKALRGNPKIKYKTKQTKKKKRQNKLTDSKWSKKFK